MAVTCRRRPGDCGAQELSREATAALIRAVQILEPWKTQETALFDQALVMLSPTGTPANHAAALKSQGAPEGAPWIKAVF